MAIKDEIEVATIKFRADCIKAINEVVELKKKEYGWKDACIFDLEKLGFGFNIDEVRESLNAGVPRRIIIAINT